MSTAKFNQWLNSDGTENYKCRAWVNFNGTGTVAIRASGNVSSITDNGTGDYTVNMTTALADTSYSVVGSCRADTSGADKNFAGLGLYRQAVTTSAFRILTTLRTSFTTLATTDDQDMVSIAVFR